MVILQDNNKDIFIKIRVKIEKGLDFKNWIFKRLFRASPIMNFYFQLQIDIFSIFRDDETHIIETQLQQAISIFNSKSLLILQTFFF